MALQPIALDMEIRPFRLGRLEQMITTEMNGLPIEVVRELPNGRVAVKSSTGGPWSVCADRIIPAWKALSVDPHQKEIYVITLYAATIKRTANYLSRSSLHSLDFWEEMATNNPITRLYPFAAVEMERSVVSNEQCGAARLIVADDVDNRGPQPGFRLTAYGESVPNRVCKAILFLPNEPNTVPVIDSCTWKVVCLSASGGFTKSLIKEGDKCFVVTDNLDAECENCGASHKRMKKCGKCGQVRYCSRRCQVADWPKHKESCRSGMLS